MPHFLHVDDNLRGKITSASVVYGECHTLHVEDTLRGNITNASIVYGECHTLYVEDNLRGYMPFKFATILCAVGATGTAYPSKTRNPDGLCKLQQIMTS